MITAELFNGVATADANSNYYDLVDMKIFSIQVTYSAADVVGTLKLQCSVDASTWIDVDNSSQAITAGAAHLWDVTVYSPRYVRVNWDYTSGTGDMLIKIYIKENVAIQR